MPGTAVIFGAAMADLGLDALYAVYPGDKRYPIHEKTEALPLKLLKA